MIHAYTILKLIKELELWYETHGDLPINIGYEGWDVPYMESIAVIDRNGEEYLVLWADE